MSMDGDDLVIWTVYRSPADHPGKWVLRGFTIKRGEARAHPDCVVGNTLDEVRAAVPPGDVRIPRDPDDVPSVYETWL